MDLTFQLFDVISLATILLSLAGSYWKLSNRLSLTEQKVEKIERDHLDHEKKVTDDFHYIHKKMNIKLESISEGLQNVLIQLAKLEERIGHDK